MLFWSSSSCLAATSKNISFQNFLARKNLSINFYLRHSDGRENGQNAKKPVSSSWAVLFLNARKFYGFLPTRLQPIDGLYFHTSS